MKKIKCGLSRENGITLVGLIVTVVVLLIIAGVSIYSGIEALNSTRLRGFYTQLEIVQKRIDDIAATNESYVDDNGNVIYLMLTGKAFEELEQEQKDNLTRIISLVGGNVLNYNVDNFRYFTSEELKSILGIYNIDFNVFIDFENRIVIAEQGIEIDGKPYHMLENTIFFIKKQAQEFIEDDVEFSIEVSKYGNSKYKIIVKPLKTEYKSKIKYKDISTKYWETSIDLEIIVDKFPLHYDILYYNMDKNKSLQKTFYISENQEGKIEISQTTKLYTTEQLLGVLDVESEKTEYSKTYLLMNNISFKPSDYEIEYWVPIGEKEIEDAKFEGNGKEIHVTYTDSKGEEYTVIYNQSNNYKEEEYEFNIVPIIREEEKIAEDAKIIVNKNGEQTEKTGKQTLTVKRGIDKLEVSAGMNNISYKGTETVYIEVQNPNKINYIKNENSYYVPLMIEYNYITFTINAMPAAAKVVINNQTVEGNGTGVFKVNNIVAGRDNVSWKVSADGYVEQSGNKPASEITENISLDVRLKKMVKLTIIQPQGSSLVINNIIGNCKEEGVDSNSNKYLIVEEGSKVIYSLTKEHYYPINNAEIQVSEDRNITLNLEPIMVTFTINPSPSDATVTINGKNTNSVTVQEGTNISWEVSKSQYETQQGNLNADNVTLDIALKTTKVTFKITPSPSDAVVTINGIETKSAEIVLGDTVNWSVSCKYYIKKEGTFIANSLESHEEIVTLQKNTKKLELTPSNVSSNDGINSINNAMTGYVTTTRASKGLGSDRTLTWHFYGSDISLNPDAIIEGVSTYYRIGAGGHTEYTVVMESGTVSESRKNEFLQGDVEFNGGISLPEEKLTTSSINTNGVTLTITIHKKNILTSGFWYGATLYIYYLEP